MIETALYTILFLSLILIGWTFIGFPAFLIFFSSFLKKHHFLNQAFFPKVTLMIMTYNEEKAIAKKLQNSLDIDYPHDKLEIFVVDSASTDKTQEITRKVIKEFYKNNPKDKRIVKLIAQEKREGKASGINYGKEKASGEIIMITDGNAMMSKNVIKNIVRHFDDPKVGGVCGRFEARDLHDTSTGEGGSIYWKIERMLRTGESNLDSCIHMSGEITAFRANIVNKLDTTQLSEDFDMAVSIRRKGFRIIYEPYAIAYEPAPTNVDDLKTQKKRIVIGTLQVLFKHKDMLFNPKYGWYGVMILTTHKLFQLLTPFALAVVLGSSAALFFLDYNLWIHGLIIAEITCVVLTLLSLILTLFNLFKHNKLLNFVKYFMASNWIVVLGWIDFLCGKKIVTWKKIESSRDI
ncbi:glycosyltransferase [Candidatus Woesearchaeota archaeon]|nr:glycosyltransferase [Candidatus Woesearchaeota archaeon]